MTREYDFRLMFIAGILIAILGNSEQWWIALLWGLLFVWMWYRDWKPTQ